MSVPAPFDYHRAQSVDDALSLLQQFGDEAKILAGGHSLLPAMKLRLAQPEHIIDIGAIAALSFIRKDHSKIVIGALTPYTHIERSDLLRKELPILPETASTIGDQQVRNRGTLGGSLAHSDPASDMPGVIMALNGEIVVRSPRAERTITADDFFLGTFTTALEPDEILTEIRFATLPVHTGTAYEKLMNKASHYAIAGCAAVITLDSKQQCKAASITITGAATQTSRATAVEKALVGQKLDTDNIQSAANHAADDLELISDIHGSEDYRRQMAIVVTRRAITNALKRV